MCIFLRPTGTSLLVCFIDLSPGDIPRYLSELAPTLSQLHQCFHAGNPCGDPSSDSISHRAFPDRFYKPCAYLGIGVHNLMTFTLVREQGFATKIAFLGNVLGQTYFHAHDYAPVFVDERRLPGDDFAPILKALRDLDISDITKLKAGDTRVKEFPAENKPFRYRYTDETGAERTYRAVYDSKDELCFGQMRPITYDRIAGGTVKDWPAEADSSDSAVSSKPWRSAMGPPFRAATDPRELIYFSQLRLNSLPLLKYTSAFRDWAYLGIILSLHQNAKLLDKERIPSFFRVFFIDGYFDMAVLLRGRNLSAMDRLVQLIQALTLGDVKTALETDGLRAYAQDCWQREWAGDLDESTPIFVLANTSLGIPFGRMAETWEKTGKITSSLWQREQDQRLKAEEMENGLRAVFNIYAGDFSYYEQEAEAKFSFKTCLSIKNCRTEEVLDDLATFERATTPPGAEPPTQKQFLLNGRYDIELFANDQTNLGTFFARLFLANEFLQRRGYGSQGSGLPFSQKINSPILELNTLFGIPTATPKAGPASEAEKRPSRIRAIYPGFKSRSMRILSPENILSQLKKLESVNRLCPPALEWLRKLETDKNPNPNQWFRFNRFLKQRFGLQVTPETLELLASTLNVVGNLLSHPLLFDLYLDLHRYCNYYIRTLFTIETEEKKGEDENVVMYYEIETDSIRSFSPRKDNYVGLEAFLIPLEDFLQRVLDQRQAGSFPNFDHCITRLADLRLQHLKKISTLSWLIERMKAGLQPEFSISSVPVGNAEFDLDLVPGPDPQKALEPSPPSSETPELHFSRAPIGISFSNSPELHYNRPNHTLSVNARFLTTNEQIILVVHEVGHICFEDVKRSLLASRTDPFVHQIQDRRTVPTDDPDRAGAKQRPMPNKASHESQDNDFPPKTLFLWEEVFADLFVFKFCFAPLNRFLFSGDFNRSQGEAGAIVPAGTVVPNGATVSR